MADDSPSWRLLEPASQTDRRFSRLARLGRRVLKLAWWTLTLQVGAKLRERRRRLSVAARRQGVPGAVPPAGRLRLNRDLVARGRSYARRYGWSATFRRLWRMRSRYIRQFVGSELAWGAGRHTKTSIYREIRKYTSRGASYEDFAPAVTVRPRAKILAYYLPQFHTIPENDAWWGKGFTEWTNITRGVPRFIGHYQPRVPRDLGFYSLDNVETIRHQVKMAKAAGLFGFVFYYYWFNGKRILETPLDRLLSDTTIDMPFCLMWANENWTRRWDGSDAEVLISQDYNLEEDEEFVTAFSKYFNDARYIRVADRPLLMIYRASLIPDLKQRIERWRSIWRSRFNENPLLIMAQTVDDIDPRPYGLDGAIEFPPHKLTRDLSDINADVKILDPDFLANTYRYRDLVQASLTEPPPPFPLIKTAIPSWDNDARRQGQGLTVTDLTPAQYEAWVSALIERAIESPFFNEPFVCINAWNEWCEAAYLEPDLHFGSAYLNATARALAARSDASDELRPQTTHVTDASGRLRQSMTDEQWLDALKRSVVNQTVAGVKFPKFPPKEIQESTVGSSFDSALNEAFSFYLLVKTYARKFGIPVNYDSKFLDFGMGWGRYIRFFWKDIADKNIYGVDVHPNMIKLCQMTEVPGNHYQIEHGGVLPFPDDTFDIMIAYSVFTHLPEDLHLHWLSELSRVSKSGCLLVLTVEPPRFIDFCINEAANRDHPWHKTLAMHVHDGGASKLKDRLQKSQYVYMPTGGGDDHLAPDVYGDAVIPLAYIQNHWTKLFELRDYIDDAERFWQAVVVLTKR